MKSTTLSVCLVFLLLGCGRVPEPVSYDYSTQKKMQASHHWNVLAADLANEINNALIMSDYINTPVYVRTTCGDENTPCEHFQASVFDETFRDLLITNLVALGVPTSAKPNEKAITVNYKAQPVYHHDKRWRTIRPGLLTTLTAGVIVFRSAPWEIAALATAGAIDFLNATYNSLGHYEVVITTSLIAKNNYLYRNTNIYYINDIDSWQYQVAARPVSIPLTAPVPPPVELDVFDKPPALEMQPFPPANQDTQSLSTEVPKEVTNAR